MILTCSFFFLYLSLRSLEEQACGGRGSLLFLYKRPGIARSNAVAVKITEWGKPAKNQLIPTTHSLFHFALP